MISLSTTTTLVAARDQVSADLGGEAAPPGLDGRTTRQRSFAVGRRCRKLAEEVTGVEGVVVRRGGRQCVIISLRGLRQSFAVTVQVRTLHDRFAVLDQESG